MARSWKDLPVLLSSKLAAWQVVNDPFGPEIFVYLFDGYNGPDKEVEGLGWPP